MVLEIAEIKQRGLNFEKENHTLSASTSEDRSLLVPPGHNANANKTRKKKQVGSSKG